MDINLSLPLVELSSSTISTNQGSSLDVISYKKKINMNQIKHKTKAKSSRTQNISKN